MARRKKTRIPLVEVIPEVEGLGWAKTIETILPKFVQLPEPQIQIPVIVAALCCYSGSANKLPILGMIGASRSGKSSLSKFIGRIHEQASPIDLTVPGLKRWLTNNRNLKDEDGKLVISKDGSVVEAHLTVRLEEVSRQKLNPQQALYLLVKNSRDSATSNYMQASLSSEEDNATIEYDVFCLMTITSIYPFFQNPEFSELDGRTIWLHFEQSIESDFLNPDDIDFWELSRNYYREHLEYGIDEYHALLSSLRKPKAISTANWDKFKDPLCSAIALNYWTKEQGIKAIIDYCEYREISFPVSRTDPLIDFLRTWLDGRNVAKPELVVTAVRTGHRCGLIPIVNWNMVMIHDAMICIGYQIGADPNHLPSVSAEPEFVWIKQVRGKS